MHYFNKKRVVIIVCYLIVILLTGVYRYYQINVRSITNGNIPNKHSQNILDGCYHIYIDVGTNIGVQIRKLFEPEKYPNAYVHSIFNSQFGNINERRKSTSENGRVVCAIGFEPNSHHTSYLRTVESSYNRCGWRVKILTETAASDRNGTTQFYTDEAYRNMEWGGGILPPNINNVAVDTIAVDNIAVDQLNIMKKAVFREVTLIRLSDFLKNIVGTRKLPVPPSNSNPPKVIMKMDIEGSEVDVIPDLIFTGGLQYINNIMIEWHDRLEKLYPRRTAQQQLRSMIKTLSEYSETMRRHGSKFDFNMMNLDDETYYTSKFDLPKCES